MIKKFILFVCFIFLVNSCELKPDCESNAKSNLLTECIAIALEKPTHSAVFFKKVTIPTLKKCVNVKRVTDG